MQMCKLAIMYVRLNVFVEDSGIICLWSGSWSEQHLILLSLDRTLSPSFMIFQPAAFFVILLTNRHSTKIKACYVEVKRLTEVVQCLWSVRVMLCWLFKPQLLYNSGLKAMFALGCPQWPHGQKWLNVCKRLRKVSSDLCSVLGRSNLRKWHTGWWCQ